MSAVSLNRVELIGHLGDAPEYRQSGNGELMILSVATSQSWKDKTSGDWRDENGQDRYSTEIKVAGYEASANLIRTRKSPAQKSDTRAA